MSRKSLGVLTVDLIARTGGFVQGMNQAERSSDKWRRQVERNIQSTRQTVARGMVAMTAATVAATAAVAAMTRAGMVEVESQIRLARSLDTTFDSVTALQMAFGDSGIDNFEASINRLNRRLGAAELGRGAALNAVKELNLDLQELANVEADERVALIADRIKEVATNSQTAARYAQDLGFEQREAAQFFLQGGDAIRGYRDQVERLGLSLSDVDATQVENARKAMGVLGDTARVVRQRLAVELSPIVQQLAQDFQDLAASTGGFSEEIGGAVDTVASAVGFVMDAVDGVGRVFKLTGSTIAAQVLSWELGVYSAAIAVLDGPVAAVNTLIATINRIPGIDIPELESTDFVKDLEARARIAYGALEAYAEDVQDILMKPLPSARWREYFDEAKKRAHEAAAAIADAGPSALGLGAEDADPDALKRQEAIAREITALERAAETWGMSAESVKLYDLALQGADHTQLSYAQSLLATIDAMEEQDRLNKEAVGIAESLRTEEEAILASYDRRRQIILDNTQITGEAQTELLRRLEEERNEQLLEINGDYWERWLAGAASALTNFDVLAGSVVENFQSQFGSAFESMIFDAESLDDAMQGMAEGMARSVINALGQMAAQWIAYQAVQLITGKATQASAATAIAANATAMSITSGINAFSSAAAIPIYGWAAAPGAMAAALAVTGPMAGAAGAAALAGMAHDGIDSVPQTGTWLLERGERVTTAETSAKLDKTLSDIQQGGSGGGTTVNVIEDASKRGTTERTTGANGQEEISVFVNDIFGDGPRSKAIAQKFGLSGVGR